MTGTAACFCYTSDMGIMGRLYYAFTPYTDARERSVGRFFKGLNERRSQKRTSVRLGRLLQRNIAVINLWTEYQYKGYRYLNKTERRELYGNLDLIADDFDRFYQTNVKANVVVEARMRRLGQLESFDLEKLVLLQSIMDYFSPMQGVYEYRESSSFGRLLRDPSREKLLGDCNQIVTLYIYLYSRYNDVRDLKIRALPKHVALHYAGIDIETTNGTFARYDKKQGSMLLPIEEIVSINLLDTTDAYLAKHEIAPEDFLQASRFAFILSHDRGIASHNLEAAYRKMVNVHMTHGRYAAALKLAKDSRDEKLLGVVGHNGAIYEMKRHDYGSARRYAKYAPKRNELMKDSWQAEGTYHYNEHRYQDALKAFEHSGDKALVRQCYEALFFTEQEKLGSNISTDSLKKYAGTIKRMRTYAKKSGNKKLMRHVSNLQKYL